MYLRLNKKQQTVISECSVTRWQWRICKRRKKTVNVLKKAGKYDFNLTTIQRQCRWNHERREPYLETITATKAEERHTISLRKWKPTKLFWEEQLKTNTDDVVPRRTVATVEHGFVLKRTVKETAGEDFVLKRTVGKQHKTSRRKKRYPNGEGFAERRRFVVPNLEKTGFI